LSTPLVRPYKTDSKMRVNVAQSSCLFQILKCTPPLSPSGRLVWSPSPAYRLSSSIRAANMLSTALES
ncbi:MAG: hypothetical protein ACK55I_02770, partial [bacterium]